MGENRPFSTDDAAFLDHLADAVVRRGMATPAILFLETCRPLNFMGSQVLVFFEPFVRPQTPDYRRLAELLESRACIDRLVGAIERRLRPVQAA